MSKKLVSTVTVLSTLSLLLLLYFRQSAVVPKRSPRDADSVYKPYKVYTPSDYTPFLQKKEFNKIDYETIPRIEDIRLSKIDGIRRLTQILMKIDSNFDEHIDRDELYSWILRSFRVFSQNEIYQRFEYADKNINCLISWREYLYDTYGTDGEDGLTVSDATTLLIQDDEDLWFLADDGDGALDLTEWGNFLHPEENRLMFPTLLRRFLDLKDNNHDGIITFEEFVDEKSTETERKIEEDEFLNKFDKDKNGILTETEIISWATPRYAEMTKEEVQHLFLSSDDDKDNLLSFSEVFKHYNIFVISRATAYGVHMYKIHLLESEF